MKKKTCYYAGLLMFVVSFLFFNVALYLKYGPDYLHVDQLYIGIPLWSILLGYAAYGSVKYYYKQKDIFLPAGLTPEVRLKREKEWKEYRYLILSKGTRILGILFGMAAPLYIFAYQEQAETLHATPFKIVCFVLLTLICLAASHLLKKKYDRFSDENADSR